MVTSVSALALTLLSCLIGTHAMPYGHCRNKTLVTEEQVLAIAPNSSTCEGDSFPEECKTASQITPFINEGLARYGVTHPGEIAALLSLMAFETGDFKFNKNHFPEPGRPGQGTRNMQSATFNIKYALSIPEIRDQAAAILGTTAENSTAVNATLIAPEKLNEVRELVLADQYDFASAAWFLDSECPRSISSGLKMRGEDGWKDYIEKCVFTTVTDDRKLYWERAVTALQVKDHGGRNKTAGPEKYS